jgi:hypothetical protein
MAFIFFKRCCTLLGARHLVTGTWFPLPRALCHAPCSKCASFGPMYRAPGAWRHVSGTKCLLPGPKSQVPGFGQLGLTNEVNRYFGTRSFCIRFQGSWFQVLCVRCNGSRFTKNLAPRVWFLYLVISSAWHLVLYTMHLAPGRFVR